MDKLFANKWFVRFLSLAFAVMLYLIVNMDPTVNNAGVGPDGEDQTYTIEDVNITPEYNEEEYAVTNMTENADVTLSGSQTAIMLFRLSRSDSYELYLDMQNLGAGTHNVQVSHRDFPTDLEVTPSPEYATVTLEEREETTFPLETQILNEEQNEEFSFGNPTVSPEEVTVSGAGTVIEQIDRVVAQVDVSEADGDINGNFPIVALDAEGNELDVNTEPQEASVELSADAPSKEVPVNVERTGSLNTGAAISEVIASDEEVTIYGSEEAVQNTDSINAALDLNEVDESGTYELDVQLPEGIQRTNPEELSASVTVAGEEQATLENVPISIVNLPSGASTSWVAPSSGQMDVQIYGEAGALEGVSAEDITLEALWSGSGSSNEESYTLPVEASGPEGIQVSPARDDVEVSLQQEENDEETEEETEPESEAPDEEQNENTDDPEESGQNDGDGDSSGQDDDPTEDTDNGSGSDEQDTETDPQTDTGDTEEDGAGDTEETPAENEEEVPAEENNETDEEQQ
ncbi:YbbR domain-containing protein [Marinococcus luteus]|uniref:YbbR domain-containing protein n=1 Tax=Marinococcus luteus TaxID=1122204 RepID=A0A1H2US02_9BACI|nr:CdaR family protein [Marinococcus luteus]SDW58891.1 YbbR domain-containing protein [Marinococcus luteus]